MVEPYYWYVLYVKSGAEARAVDALSKAFKDNGRYDFEAFCPESEQYFRNKAGDTLKKSYRKRPLFSSYVFVETEMPREQFKRAAFDVVNRTPEIIRLLSYGDREDIALRREERERIEYLLGGKRCLEHSVGYIEGDKVVVTGGPLIGMEGSIKKINRHNRSAEVELEMFGQKQTVKLALEIVSKNG